MPLHPVPIIIGTTLAVIGSSYVFKKFIYDPHLGPWLEALRAHPALGWDGWDGWDWDAGPAGAGAVPEPTHSFAHEPIAVPVPAYASARERGRGGPAPGRRRGYVPLDDDGADRARARADGRVPDSRDRDVDRVPARSASRSSVAPSAHARVAPSRVSTPSRASVSARAPASGRSTPRPDRDAEYELVARPASGVGHDLVDVSVPAPEELNEPHELGAPGAPGERKATHQFAPRRTAPSPLSIEHVLVDEPHDATPQRKGTRDLRERRVVLDGPAPTSCPFDTSLADRPRSDLDDRPLASPPRLDSQESEITPPSIRCPLPSAGTLTAPAVRGFESSFVTRESLPRAPSSGGSTSTSTPSLLFEYEASSPHHGHFSPAPVAPGVSRTASPAGSDYSVLSHAPSSFADAESYTPNREHSLSPPPPPRLHAFSPNPIPVSIHVPGPGPGPGALAMDAPVGHGVEHAPPSPSTPREGWKGQAPPSPVVGSPMSAWSVFEPPEADAALNDAAYAVPAFAARTPQIAMSAHTLRPLDVDAGGPAPLTSQAPPPTADTPFPTPTADGRTPHAASPLRPASPHSPGLGWSDDEWAAASEVESEWDALSEAGEH
ncbi:hypothetical protein Q5752_006698 [Cryptotrichosporon argae]